MNDQEKSREQLIAELEVLRRQIAGQKALPEVTTAAALFQVAPLGIHECDIEGRITFVNPSQEAITGFSASELVGTYLWDRIAPGPEKDALPAHFRQLVSEQPAPTPFFAKNIRKSGEVFDARVDWNYIRNVNGEITGFVSVVSDITELKQAESSASESERRISTLMSNLPGMAYRCQNSANWSMEFVSDGALQLTGYQASDLIGSKTVTFGDLVHADDREAVWDQVQQAIAKRRRFHLEYRISTASGEQRWVWEQGCGVYSDDGELEAIEGFTTDVTPQKQAELELRKAHDELEQRVEERTAELTVVNERLQTEVEQRRKADADLMIFRRFVESSTQGFGMADVDGQIIYANPFLARLFGAESSEDVIGTHVSTYYPADYPVRREREIIPALRRNEHWQGEQMLAFPDGQMHTTIHTIFPVRDENGELFCTAAAITDVTELKRTEEALRQSYEELQTVYDCIVDGILIADIETKAFVKANRAIGQMLGYSPDELLSMSVRDIHPPNDLAAILATFQSQAEGSFLRAESLPTLRRDGSVLLADITSSPIIYNARPCLIGIFRDVTARRRAEEVIRQSEAKYKSLVDSCPDAVAMADLQGRILFASQRVAEQHDVSDPDELLGKQAAELVVEEDRERFQANIRRLIKEGVRHNDAYRGLRTDGSKFEAEISSAIIRDAEGKPGAMIGVYRDVTERKEAQDALQKEQDALRRMLQASDRDRELVTYEIHDGIAQRLAAAGMYLEAVSKVVRGIEKARADLDAGLRALREASAEARSLMNRTRTPVLDKFGLKAAIADFIDQFTDRPDAPEITYRCETQFKRLEPVLENTIFRVAQEAITNACIHSESEIVRVSLIQEDEELTLEVEDYGIGLDVTKGKKDRFGLDSIRERVRLLGKNLDIESTPGQGTRIEATFTLIYRKEEAG